MSVDAAIQSCLTNLQTYLQTNVAGLTVKTEWPAANDKMTYPTLTLFSGKVQYMNRDPEPIALTTPDGEGMVVQTLVVGELDFKMQLDLWCANKFQRSQFIDLIDQAINKQVLNATGNNSNGLSLQLTNYYNDWARFDLDGTQYIDDEAAAQRQERRAKIDLLVNCRDIKQRTGYAIETLQVQIGVGPDSITWGELEDKNIF